MRFFLIICSVLIPLSVYAKPHNIGGKTIEIPDPPHMKVADKETLMALQATSPFRIMNLWLAANTKTQGLYCFVTYSPGYEGLIVNRGRFKEFIELNRQLFQELLQNANEEEKKYLKIIMDEKDIFIYSTPDIETEIVSFSVKVNASGKVLEIMCKTKLGSANDFKKEVIEFAHSILKSNTPPEEAPEAKGRNFQGAIFDILKAILILVLGIIGIKYIQKKKENSQF
ncbi:hypothetical protein KKF34_11310 [Myxococcota bacterium]|nr:hypothetical protein [Myxococcota bacterium]MBU1380456.1 hypothetical protein [Myxococcota bacterium]MBU1497451.1 hypothetical protein [Myxococcota bacterium]